MIIKCDAKQLEWRSYLELSRDPAGIDEVLSNLDIHSRNQGSLGLPSRLVAKVFIFRWIYRGPAYSYSVDPDFSPVSSSQDFWQDIIDKANLKYHVLYQYQNKIIQRAQQGNVIYIPSGRAYKFEPRQNPRTLAWEYSEPDITNYINQGFAADLVALARRRLLLDLDARQLRSKALLINTVHDDVELDVDNDPQLLYDVSCLCEDAFEAIPEEGKKWYDYEFALPFAGEVSFGPNLGFYPGEFDKEGNPIMKKFDRQKGVEQFL